ncbi:porin OmpC [Martelella alba]|uniref:Porin OmpC n=1 Tax=Martelella alba TaxID=2590451 RepID=A0ABY2SI14_9HYPH|nr:porin OmpC [Martelella alba]TKI04794.1 porin OmpC [Martelella alba]
MKLRLLSIAMPAFFMSSMADAAEIYNKNGNKLDFSGSIVGVHYFSDNKQADGDQSYMRFGFQGETQINDQLTGYGRWQHQAELNRTEDESKNKGNSTLLGYVGLRYGQYGSFDYGRNFGILYDVMSWTDMLPELGGDTYGVDDMMSNRGNGLATYRNRGFFGQVEGLDFAVQYQGKNTEGKRGKGRDVMAANGDGFGMSASYKLSDRVSVAGAFSTSKRTEGQRNLAYGGGDRANAYSGALKYDHEAVYLAMMYTQSYNLMRFGDAASEDHIHGFASRARNLEFVAQYLFDFGLRPTLAYVLARGNRLGDYGSQDLRKYIDISASYNFNKNMLAYVDYQINLLKENNFSRAADIHRENILALGMVYQF